MAFTVSQPGRILLPIVNSPSKVQLDRLSYVSASHPDLSEFEVFAEDFGFIEEYREHNIIYYRGYGKDLCCYEASESADGEKHFNGAAYIAKTEQDFLKATALPDASPVTENPGPCGGKRVSLSSPSGTLIHILWGVKERPAPAKPLSATEIQKGATNTALEKHRKGQFPDISRNPGPID